MRNIRYSITKKVPASAIDIRGHVNNLVYLEWCLEVAEQHWDDLSKQETKDAYVWYVLNHYIEYKASSFKDDELLIETWIESMSGVRSERHYKITRLADNQVIVNAKTTWCLLDAKTVKPTRIPKEFHNLFEG